MNSRRSFFKQLAVGAASFAILPGATTYERIWRPTRVSNSPIYVVNPDYVNGNYDLEFVFAPNFLPQRFRFIDHHKYKIEIVPPYIELKQ